MNTKTFEVSNYILKCPKMLEFLGRIKCRFVAVLGKIWNQMLLAGQYSLRYNMSSKFILFKICAISLHIKWTQHKPASAITDLIHIQQFLAWISKLQTWFIDSSDCVVHFGHKKKKKTGFFCLKLSSHSCMIIISIM